MIIAGDVGGTKTVLSLFERTGSGLEERGEQVFPSREHDTFDEILEQFLAQHRGERIDALCLGVAGAVVDGTVDATNLPWVLSETNLARASGAPRAKLLNDLEAAAYGMLELGPEERRVLNPARDPGRRGNAAVIAAGTGLGEAILYWDGAAHHAIASEGGHVDFAPRNDEEFELLRFLRAEFGRVSAERVLSGPGFWNVYRFARHASEEPEPEWLSDRLKREDPSAVVSEVALAEGDPVCAHAMELFVSLYGAQAGNLALTAMSVGGVYVGGGIGPKILPALERGTFMDAFCDKGRFAELLSGIEVSVALNVRAPLIGAAHFAGRLI